MDRMYRCGLAALLLGWVGCGGNIPASDPGSASGSNGNSTGGVASTSGSGTSSNSIAAAGPTDLSKTLDYFQAMKTGVQQFQVLCSRGYGDRFAKAYCASAAPPSITSLADLLNLVGMAGKFGSNQGTVHFALNSQNTSLVSRSTSVLNPRAILYDSASPFIAFGFARGDNVVEIAAQDQDRNDINFFLVHYKHACDATSSCTNADRFLASNESDWTSVDIYSSHDDLVNTVRQCDTCHRPQGFNYSTMAGAPAILRMQELVNPWTHWFRSNRGGVGLVNTFCATHSDAYAAIPNQFICGNGSPQNTGGDPQTMQNTLIQAHNFQRNPNVIIFSGNQINQDNNNFVGPPNQNWLNLFSRVLNGSIIHIPHYEINSFDGAAVSSAGAAYKAVVAGSQAPSSMPDLTADVLLRSDAQQILGHQAITTNPITSNPATATEVVNQMCATCHRGVFPGSGNRENFQVSEFPDKLSADEKLKVANRICRPASSVYLMPPMMYGELDDNARNLILSALGMPTPCPPIQ